MAPSEHDARLSKNTFSQLARILSIAKCPLFPDGIAALLIPITIAAYMVAGYYVILAPGNLYNALVSEDWKKFRSGLTAYGMWATAVIVLKALRGLLRESSANYLRKRLTDAIHAIYFGSTEEEKGYGASPYYRVAMENRIDNPDQRIVLDARDFASSLLCILAGGSSEGENSGGLLEASASLLFYSRQNLLRTGWYGILVAYVWSFLVAVVSVYVINRTSPVMFKQEQLEADFRYAHTELRRHAEEVAFLRGGVYERRKVAKHLDTVISNMWTVIRRHMSLNFVQYGFSYYVSLIMYLAMALAVQTNVFEGSGMSFSSQMSPGEKAQWISQTGGIFIQLLYSFTMIIQLGTATSTFVTNTNRVSTMISEMRGPQETGTSLESLDLEPLLQEEETSISGRAFHCSTSQGISADNLCLRRGSTRVGPVSFILEKGQWVLIEGPSGSGKTSVLRALRGLWAPSSGSIHIPVDDNSVMFSPQLPFISSGLCTLRELVRYPQFCTYSEDETARVLNALHAVGWMRHISSELLDIKANWAMQLSPGEAQLIAAARILDRSPNFAVMDEPTSSLDLARERMVMLALKESGISVLTVGHRQTLPPFHDKIISVDQMPN